MAEGGTQEERSRNAGAEAVETGLRSGLLALGVSSVCVGLANQFWPGFRNGLNVSGKTALVVRPLDSALLHGSRNQSIADSSIALLCVCVRVCSSNQPSIQRRR
mmetsp:Transcript_14171/g.40164  ORF Transcript_14171/g.40164 Transcript_14171/m.40164 type:complete len:104 (-) Transcript_14171:376-687(-)